MAAEAISKMSLEPNYIMVAAIDFGTTFSGYAFAFKSEKDKILMNKSWGQNVGAMACKTPTCLMVNAANKFVAFGYEAEDRYAGLQEADSDDEDDPGECHLFRHFKMMLHGDEKLTKSRTITSLDGKIMIALDVFSMALEYLKNHLIEAVSQQLQGSLDESLIRWVITVPAIWREEAKQFMREAAFKAGMTKTKDSDQLLIALEPEAASVYCRSLGLNHFIGEFGNDAKPKFKTGTKYLVIDAGGGTVDLTTHEVLITGKVKEISTASGGAWGGTKVDQNFIVLLEELFGKNFINAFQKQCPQQWLLFMVNFERVKRSVKPDGKSKLKLPIPHAMFSKCQAICGKQLEDLVELKNKPGFLTSNGIFILKNALVASLFEPVLQSIVSHITSLLQNPGMDNLQYFMLVGGFSESAFLQKSIKGHFACRFSVLIPEEAQLCVTKGAVQFGYCPDDIQIRKARHTYGIETTLKFDPTKHDEKYKVVIEGIERCKSLFDVHIVKNTDVLVGKPVMKRYSPTVPNQKNMTINIVQSKHKDVKYTDEEGCKKLGKICVDMPNVEKDLDRTVEVEMTFGGTEIQVQACDVESGCTAQTVVEFLED